MNFIKNWLHPKRAASPAAKPGVEAEEVPTMILDGAPFRTYRLQRKLSGTAPQPQPSAGHMCASR